MNQLATFGQMESTQKRALDQQAKRAAECVTCLKCDSQWFQQVVVSRYALNHNIILGQDVPEEPNTLSYKLLQCVVCNNYVEPRVTRDARDIGGGPGGSRYNNLLDTLEGKFDKREKKNAIPGQVV